MGNLCYFRAVQGHSGGIPISPELMKYTPISSGWKKYLFHKGNQWVFQSILVSRIIPGGQSCLSDSLDSFWKGPGRGEASFLSHSSPKNSTWNQMETQPRWCVLGTIERSATSRIELWHTKSFAIMTYFTIPGDCILTVWLLKTEIEYFSRGLRLQGPHPRSRWRGIDKASSSSKSSSRSSPFHTQTYYGNREQHGKARRKCKTTRNTSKKRTKPPRNWCRPLLTRMWILISVTKESAQLVKNEVVKEAFTDTNTKAIERIKIGSCKICICEDLAKEKMVFSQESSQVIFDMGNVELIELKTSMIQCPSCLHNVLGRRYKHGPKLWQEHHHKAKDALRGFSKNKKQKTSIWDRWQNGETHRESQLAINWSDAWVRYLDNIAKINFTCGVSTKTSQRHLYKKKDQDTKTQRKHWLTCTSKYDKIAESRWSQKLKGNPCEISSILHCKGISSG